MKNNPSAARCAAVAVAVAVALPMAAHAQPADEPAAGVRTLDRVTVTGGRPSTLPVEIPTTTETISGHEVDRRINATDAEDALKYFPSLLVRKRYIGDHDHAVLATRASGTGNSARSLVYADGVLLSNLLGNGASFTPRWGLVTPEEIDRVDVLYGPFSAAYPGNSAGAIVDYVTRMPRQFEAHLKLQGFSQDYRLYATDDRFSGHQGSASLGSRSGGWSWRVNVSRMDSQGQPVSFVQKPVSDGEPAGGGTPVSGAVPYKDPKNADRLLFGTTGQTHTRQDHAKLKLAYDLSPTLRASYTLASWENDSDRRVESFLRDTSGNRVEVGGTDLGVNVDGRRYTLRPTDFAGTRGHLEHLAQGLSLRSNTRGVFDWEAAAGRYDYRRDTVRSTALRMTGGPAPAAVPGITDLKGTGWTTLALKGIWRPEGEPGAHTVEGGVQRDVFRLRTRVSDTDDWLGGVAGPRVSAFDGNTSLQSLWAQDAWRFAPGWKTVLGGRLEQWRAYGGAISNATQTQFLSKRRETHFSPKVALAWEVDPAWTLKASLGRAVRMPTVSELFQGSIAAGVVVNNDPKLKPEKSWTSELTAERQLTNGHWRGTLFFERTADALYTQPSATAMTVQNVDAIRTRGLELAWQAGSAWIKGLDLNGSLTYAHSVITRNDRFPASVGRWQPRVPRWRASLLASYALDDQWSGSLGARYSGRQYGQIDNSDTNDSAYTGFSRFFVADVRLNYRVARQWTMSAGIDNLNNRTYWAFHPYPQRTYSIELKFDTDR